MTDTREPKPPGRAPRPHNLYLSDEAVERGERYSAALGESLSDLVDQLLRALPLEELLAGDELPPTLRHLRHLLARGGPPEDWREEYREHLTTKHFEEERE